MQSPTYKFIGDGAGIPGLPHVITLAEATALGEIDTLQTAIQNGSYAPLDPIDPPPTQEETTV